MMQATYIVLTDSDNPQVHFLTRGQRDMLNQRLQIAGEKLASIRHAWLICFGVPAVDVLAASSPELLELYALEYEGPHQVAVRGLAAALLLGRPIGHGKPPGEADGGVTVKADIPKPPKGPKPLGGIYASLTTEQVS